MWDSLWVVSTIFVALFRKFGTIWHLNTAAGEVAYCYSKSEVKLSQSACNNISMYNKCLMQSCLWSPASKMLQVPLEYQTTAGYDSSPHPSLALIMSFNAWSSTNKYPILKPTNKYLIWSSTYKYLFGGTHIKVHLLSPHRLNQVKRDCACMCSFSFFVSACVCIFMFIMKPPRDMQDLALCTWVSTCVHVSLLTYQRWTCGYVYT